MPKSVIIIGAGFAGAALAMHLTEAGADVHILEQRSAPAHAVTGRSFGWLNIINEDPKRFPDLYSFRQKALEEHARFSLQTANPAWSPGSKGSLVWHKTSSETEELVKCHRAYGSAVELITKREIQKLEPHFRHSPEVAAWSPNDFALEPRAAVDTLLKRAQSAGARLSLNANVTGFSTNGAQITAIHVNEKRYTADYVIFCAGPSTNTLLTHLDQSLPLSTSPARLIELSCSSPVMSHILSGPEFEIRQTRTGHLACVCDAEPFSEKSVAQLQHQIQTSFSLYSETDVISNTVGERPMPEGRKLLVGFLPGFTNSYVFLMHPGLIMGLFTARLSATEILTGQSSPILDKVRITQLS